MTSGSKICTLLFGLMLPWWASASTPDDAAALVAALGRPAPARTAFAEARFMQVLSQPLVVSGELAWLGGDTLQRRVERPRPETATIAHGEVTQQRAGGRSRSFSLQRAPQLQVLVDSFVALLSGDAGKLQQAFTIEHSGALDTQWMLTLTPRDAMVARTVANIRIVGHGNQPRCMQMQEADGDLAIDLLGPLAAQMPAAPTTAALIKLCQGL
jgi:hypothetical protein